MAVERMTISRDEIRNELDEGSRAVLGLTADQFVTRYCAAELDLDSPSVLRLSVLARLLLGESLRQLLPRDQPLAEQNLTEPVGASCGCGRHDRVCSGQISC